MSIGNKIAEIRKSKGLSQKEIALTIGADRAQYSRIENDKANPTIQTLEKIANALNVQVKDFFNDEESFDINSFEKSLVEKVKLLNQLDDKVKSSIFNLIDTAIANKRYNDFFKQQINTP